MRVAIVHDYFTQFGGAEKVAAELAALFPEASIFATVAFPEYLPSLIESREVSTSWMQKLPKIRKYYRAYFPLYPLGVRALDFTEYDLVLSSSSGYSKGIRTRHDALHICYCHTPMRWAWDFDRYAAREQFGYFTGAIASAGSKLLRRWDRNAAQLPDHIVANSRTVEKRIMDCYDRAAEVIHPPIDVGEFKPSSQLGDYYLVLARMAPYKRIDLAVEACTRLGKKLLVIGEGTDRARLEKLAGETVSFLGRVSDSTVRFHAARCKALLFPGEEDFGMAPLEVAASGRPTIAFGAGGALESIMAGETGLFFQEQTTESLMDAIRAFEGMDWNPGQIRAHAEKFSTEVFRSQLVGLLNRVGVQVRAHWPHLANA